MNAKSSMSARQPRPFCKDTMVKKTSLVKLKKNLNCKNFGSYAAKCSECEEFYVGQAITSFSQRWYSHRHIWKSTITDKVNDRAALKLHYAKKHKTSKKDLKEAFSIIFLDTTKNYSDLDFLEIK